MLVVVSAVGFLLTVRTADSAVDHVAAADAQAKGMVVVGVFVEGQRGAVVAQPAAAARRDLGDHNAGTEAPVFVEIQRCTYYLLADHTPPNPNCNDKNQQMQYYLDNRGNWDDLGRMTH